jgi:two-component system response regulator RegX3
MTDSTQRVLLVEDERPIREAVAAYLEREGYWVTAVVDGEEALEAASRKPFDLVVLDLNLPKVSGEEVCRRIRDTSDVPIIMLTAKGAEEERVRGFEMGADDYLVKPFSPRELIARVRALLRRAHAESDPQRDRIEHDSLEIDLPSHRVHLDGTEIELTASEYKLLVTLARYPGRVYPRMELVEKVLGYDFEGYERAIDSHVKNLRSKLDDDARDPRFIHTVTGVGYRFEPTGRGPGSGSGS